jgi:hypothetical protein
MTTPCKEDIIAKAFEIQQQRNHNVSSITPEIEEVKESGIYSEAQRSLMRNEENQVLDYLEQLAHENGYRLIRERKQQNHVDLKTLCSEILKFGGLFIVANKGMGKTNTLQCLARELRKDAKNKVIIFETFPKWIHEFDTIPYVYIEDGDVIESDNSFKNLRNREVKRLLNIHKDLIFCLAIEDIERLSFFMSSVIYDVYRKRYLTSYKYGLEAIKENLIVIVEESQNLFDSTVLNKTVFRRLRKIYTESRNFKIHYVMASQRLQDLNTKIRARARLLVGRVSLDDYELKISRLLRNSSYRKEVLNFRIGKFVYPALDSLICFDKFQQHGKPYEVSQEMLVLA